MSVNAFQSIAGNLVQNVAEIHPGFIVTQFMLDTGNPILETFTVDMNTGSITLTFSKAVSYQSLQLQQLMLQSALDSAFLAVATYAGFCPHWSVVVGPNHHSENFTTTQLWNSFFTIT